MDQQSHSLAEGEGAERSLLFIGRVTEQRQFQVALQGLLAHHRRWREAAAEIGSSFDPEAAPGDDSYARVFLPYGIGGIGKTWLTRRCIVLAEEAASDPAILTLYDDLSLTPTVLTPTHLLERLYNLLVKAGYEKELAPYRQARADAPKVAARVARYKDGNRERWNALVETASALIARGAQAVSAAHGFPLGDTGAAFIKTATAETVHAGAAALAKAHDLLVERMQQEGKLTSDEAQLFRDPEAAQAAQLVRGLQQVARQRPLVIALDTLEVVVPLERFLRDSLVLPTAGVPLLWLLSGRYNLAGERMVEVRGQRCTHKGYRDLLGRNPPVAWDVTVFGDSDVREYLEAESRRRNISLEVDDALVAAVKGTSGGVPLAMEMVGDALFALDRSAFLGDFAFSDETLLPAERLKEVTARFLRYCLVRDGDDLERVRGMALLRQGADARALRAVWNLPQEQRVEDVLHRMRSRYACVRVKGLHNAVYDFARRELRTSPTLSETREMLAQRAVIYTRTQWKREHAVSGDPALRTRDPRWQEATRDLLNALFWADPDAAVRFLLPRFVEGLGFDIACARGLLEQAEEFLAANTSPLRRADSDLLRRLRKWTGNIWWSLDIGGLFGGQGEAAGTLLETLLKTPGLEPLHLSVLHLWRGRVLAEGKQYAEALEAYLEAERDLPDGADDLREQLARAFKEIGWNLGWKQGQAIPSPEAELALSKAVGLNGTEGSYWVGLGVMKHGLKKNVEAAEALNKGIKLEGEKAYSLNWLGNVYCQQGQHDEASEAYRKAIELDPKYASPWNGLGAVYGDLGRHDEASEAYRKAIELDPKYASPWNGLGNVYGDLGQNDEAIEVFHKSLELDPKYAYPWNGLGNVYRALGRNDEASAAYRQAIELDPKYASPWHGLGNVYHDLGRNDEASEAYRTAIELDPKLADPHRMLGALYELEGWLEEALREHRRAVELQPDIGACHISLASVLRKLGHEAEAAEHLTRARELMANATAYNKACFEAIAGNADAALAHLERALEQAPGDRLWASRDPDLASLHDDPRFGELVGEV